MTQLLLRETTKKKIAYLLSKHAIKDVEVYNLIKEFFQEYLKADYEFTFDELAQELKKTYIEKHIKETLFKLLEDFSTIEYKDEDLPDEMLKEFLNTFSKLVDELIKEEQKRGFFSRLFGKKLPKKTQKPSREKQPLEQPKDASEEQPAKEPPAEKQAEPEPNIDLSALQPSTLEIPQEQEQETKKPEDDQELPVVKQEEVMTKPEDKDKNLVPEELAGSQPADRQTQKEFSGWGEDNDPSPHDQERSSHEEPIIIGQDAGQEQEAHEQPAAEQAQPMPVEKEPEPVQEPPRKEQPQKTISPDEEQLSQDLSSLSKELDDVMQQSQPSPQPTMQDTIKALISETASLIAKRHYEKARHTYKELLSLYHALSEHDKHQFYEQIQRFYDTLQQQ